jgi:hypothetical protein
LTLLHYNDTRQPRTQGVTGGCFPGGLMSLQRLATIAEVGFLAAAVGAHGAVLAFCLADHAAGATAVGNFTAEILRPVQLSILPLWLVLGPGPKRVRWLAIPLFAGLLYAWSDLPYPEAAAQGRWLALEAAGMLLILSLLWRLVGGRVRRPLASGAFAPPQFSIRGLLITTTLAALLVAAGKWTYSHVQAVATNNQPSLLDLDPLIARTAVAAGLSLITLAAWWAVFRPRHVWLASSGVAALSGGCGMLMTLLLHEEDAWMSFGVWWLLHAATIMATLAPLRQLSFRICPANSEKLKHSPSTPMSRLPLQGASS